MFLVCVSECVYKVLHKSRSETREIKSEKETWWWQQKRRKKYAEKVQWNEKSADYCLANRKTKGNVLTKFSMKMRAFSSFFYISMCIYVCVCVLCSFWPNQSHWPIEAPFRCPPLPWLDCHFALHQFHLSVYQIHECPSYFSASACYDFIHFCSVYHCFDGMYRRKLWVNINSLTLMLFSCIFSPIQSWSSSFCYFSAPHFYSSSSDSES